MKKLFFTALVAVVAVGGAYADQYVYDLGGPAEETFTCQGAGSSCAEFASRPAESIYNLTQSEIVEDNSIFLTLTRTAE